MPAVFLSGNMKLCKMARWEAGRPEWLLSELLLHTVGVSKAPGRLAMDVMSSWSSTEVCKYSAVQLPR